MIPPGEQPIFGVQTSRFFVQNVLGVIGSAPPIIPAHEPPLITGGFSAVMMVDNWIRIISSVPVRRGEPRHQFGFVTAVDRTGAKPFIESANLFQSGSTISDVGTLNETRPNKAASRDSKRFLRFLDGNPAIGRIKQQNAAPNKAKLRIFPDRRLHRIHKIWLRVTVVVDATDYRRTSSLPTAILGARDSPTWLNDSLDERMFGLSKVRHHVAGMIRRRIIHND